MLVFKTKEKLEDLERKHALVVAEMADLELRFTQLKRDLGRVFMRVSRDFIVHSEKLDPDKEGE